MTNIYAALKRAKEERGQAKKHEEHEEEETSAEKKEPEESNPLAPQLSPSRVPSLREQSPFGRSIETIADLRLSEQMTMLHESISSILSTPGGKTILFIGPKRGEGTSVLLREFAKVSTLVLGQSVLLLDAHQKRPSQLQYFGIDPRHGWEECVRDGAPLKDVIYRIRGERLYVSQLSVGPPRAPRISDMPRISDFFEGLKQRFDLVLIDAPSAAESSDGLALSRRVDGVILVVEAEKTRRQVAQRVRERIEDLGGPILGVVLNKRRYPIPGFIYDWL